MIFRAFVLTGMCTCIVQLAVAGNTFDLEVCRAHSDRAGQLSCCAELDIPEARCRSAGGSQESVAKSPSADMDPFFYCKTRDLDGSDEDINRWGKGTDFKFIPAKNIWEWRTDHSVRSIDAGGGFYETSLIRNGTDRIGDCGPDIKWQYEKRLEAIKERYKN